MKWIGNFDGSLADITSVVAGTGLSGGGTTGAVTLNVDASIPEITTLAGLASIGTHDTDLKVTSFTGFDVDRTAAQGNAGAESITALHVDFDRTVPTSGTYVHKDLGIDLDVTSASLGTSSLTGMDIDVVGNAGASGNVQTATGIELNVQGADVNNGMHIFCEGEQLKLSHNAADYATFTVADTGDLTIATVGDATTDSDLTLDADGDILLKTATGFYNLTSTATSSATVGAKINLISDDGAVLGDDHMLGKIGFHAAEDSGGTTRQGAAIKAFADAAWSDTENGTRLEFHTMDADNVAELSLTLDSDRIATFTGGIDIANRATSHATAGGVLRLGSDDGAALEDDHRLGGILFQAAEDGSSNLQSGAKINAYADAAWSGSENGTRLEFYTMDGDASSELSLTLDSDLLATFAGDLTLGGKINGPVEIEQGASGGGAALLIDNDDVDQNALKISAANTTEPVVDINCTQYEGENSVGADKGAVVIDCNSMVHGSTALLLDIDETSTIGIQNDCMVIDYDRTGNLGSGGTANHTTGLNISMNDLATGNHATSTSKLTGIEIILDHANADALLTQQVGIDLTLTDGDTGYVGTSTPTVGLLSTVENGGFDIKMQSSTDTGDHCTIKTGGNGATTITTVDDDAAAAHFEVAADGDITLDSAGQIKLEPAAGNNILLDGTVTVDGGSVTGITTLGVDSVSLTAVQTSGESFVDNDTSIMTSAAIDDKINTKYARSVISFIGQATMLSSGNWVLPPQAGIANHTWNTDSGVNTETNGSSTATLAKQQAHAGIMLPYACVIENIYCGVRNASGNRQVTAGLFVGNASAAATMPQWGTTTAAAPILKIHADSSYGGGTSYTNRPTFAVVSTDVTMAAGDMFWPGFKLTGVTSSGDTDTVIVNFNVGIKTLIV